MNYQDHPAYKRLEKELEQAKKRRDGTFNPVETFHLSELVEAYRMSFWVIEKLMQDHKCEKELSSVNAHQLETSE